MSSSSYRVIHVTGDIPCSHIYRVQYHALEKRCFPQGRKVFTIVNRSLLLINLILSKKVKKWTNWVFQVNEVCLKQFNLAIKSLLDTFGIMPVLLCTHHCLFSAIKTSIRVFSLIPQVHVASTVDLKSTLFASSPSNESLSL